MTDALDWFSRLTLFGWLQVAALVVVAALGLALVWDYERLLKRTIAAENRLEQQAKRQLALARRILAIEAELDPPDDEGGRHADRRAVRTGSNATVGVPSCGGERG